VSRHGSGARSDVAELAKRHGRGEEYVDKLISDQFFNGSSLAIAQRYSPADEPKEVFVGGPHANVEDWSDGTGLFAASSMLHGLRAASSIFGWDEPSEVGELFAETERLKELAGVEADGADPGGSRTVAPELFGDRRSQRSRDETRGRCDVGSLGCVVA
jgi:hypothetical protein